MSPSSTVHGGQYDTQYVTLELLLHATFVVGTIWGVCLKQPVEENDFSGGHVRCSLSSGSVTWKRIIPKISASALPTAYKIRGCPTPPPEPAIINVILLLVNIFDCGKKHF